MKRPLHQFTIMHLLGMVFVVSVCLAMWSVAIQPAPRGMNMNGPMCGMGCPIGLVGNPFERVYIAGPSDSEFIVAEDL